MRTNSLTVVGLAIMFVMVVVLGRMITHQPCHDRFATGLSAYFGKTCR